MTYKIKSKKQAKGIFDKLKQIERNWELKRKKSQKEKEKYEEIKKKHEEKLNKIYQKELKRLKKIKDKEDEIARVKALKDKARKEIMGLTPEELKEEAKKREIANKESAKKRAETWELVKKGLRFVIPKPEKARKMTKAERKEQREIDKAWGDIK